MFEFNLGHTFNHAEMAAMIAAWRSGEWRRDPAWRRLFVITMGASAFVCGMLASFIVAGRAADDPLPSWNDGPTKEAIVGFVEKVTEEGGPDYVPPAPSQDPAFLSLPIYTEGEIQAGFGELTGTGGEYSLLKRPKQ